MPFAVWAPMDIKIFRTLAESGDIGIEFLQIYGEKWSIQISFRECAI